MGHQVAVVSSVVLSVVLLGKVAVAPAEAEEAGAARPLRLSLVWIDVLDVAPFAFVNATREASEILAGAGIEAQWRLGEASTVCTEDELKIVLMEGISNGARLPEHVMGGTRRGAQSHTTWVYLSNVLWALGLQDRPRKSFTPIDREEIARALGRVTAHEIVHALAPDLPHSRHGLMADRIGRAQLVTGTVSLSPAEGRALRVGLASFASHGEPTSDAIAMAAARR